jgi:hypothetical protein
MLPQIKWNQRYEWVGHRQPNVMVACTQAHVAQAMDCIVLLYPKVGKCNQTNDTYTFKRHVLKGETSKRNDRNETAETIETTETTETKRPKRNNRNETTETKRPKRNDRNETAENINYRKNGKY